MEKIYYEKRQLNLSFILALIIYSVIGIFLLKYYQYQINPDGVSYISIAQKYLNGNFNNAVNGYWGPLISWLLIPFLFFGLPPLFAVKLLSLIIGLLTVIGVRRLSYRFEISGTIRNAILFSLIPIILYFSLSIITSDLLLACTLIYYLDLIFNDNYTEGKYNGAFCGVIGAIAYLAKNYAFPFFLSHFLLFNIFHCLRGKTKEKRGKVLRNLFFCLAVFFIISGTWISIISNKYNEITIGTTAKFNIALVEPGSQGFPMHYQGLLSPPNENAVSAWEDPSYLKVNRWNPLQSWNDFMYELKKILRNTYATVYVFQSFSLLSITIIIAYILFCIQPPAKIISRSDVLYPLVTMALYSAGYILLFIEPRYLWLNYLLLILMGGYLLNKLFYSEFFNTTRKIIALVFFILSFVFMPTNNLIRSINADKDIYILSKILKNRYSVSGNIASNTNWHNSLYLSHHLNSKYYGETKGDTTYEGLDAELKKNNIDYYFVWDEPNDGAQFLSKYEEVTDGKISGLRVYSLRDGIIRKAADTKLSEETMNETFKKNKPASDIFIDSGNNSGQE